MTRKLMVKNNAAWADGPGKAIRIGAHNLRTPGPHEVLVRNRAVAVNPYDCFQQATGEFVPGWPVIFGHDLAGEVASVGEHVERFVPGQRILAQACQQGLENTAFQEYSIVHEDVACPIPDEMPFESASVIPLALTTASAGLYRHGYLELPLPQVSPTKSGRTLLVWGGSSSVGSAAIQLAIASGLDVVTTASPRNFDYCRRLGATEVFDYSSSTVVKDVIAALKGSGNIAGAYAAVSSAPEIVFTIAQVLTEFGGGFIATTKPPPKDLPGNVSAKMVFAEEYAPVEGKKFFKDFLPAALEGGSYKATPEPLVVGHSLGSIQKGLETLNGGVSAKKVVITL